MKTKTESLLFSFKMGRKEIFRISIEKQKKSQYFPKEGMVRNIWQNGQKNLSKPQK